MVGPSGCGRQGRAVVAQTWEGTGPSQVLLLSSGEKKGQTLGQPTCAVEEVQCGPTPLLALLPSLGGDT